MGELTKVTIDFQSSHLLFPIIIGCVLAVLGLAIVVRERSRITTSGSHWHRIFAQMDKFRFFGTLALTLAYFSLMVPVGDFWPNTGRGFLLCSIPFVFLAGLLFMHVWTARSVLILATVAVLVPSLIWWLFTEVFFLTLP